MHAILLSGWIVICALLALMNVNHFAMAARSRFLVILGLMTLGNIVWILVNYGVFAKEITYKFLAQWFVIHGMTTVTTPILLSRIRLHPLQVLGFIFMSAGVAIVLWPRMGG